jgi:hypothetical protein
MRPTGCSDPILFTYRQILRDTPGERIRNVLTERAGDAWKPTFEDRSRLLRIASPRRAAKAPKFRRTDGIVRTTLLMLRTGPRPNFP